MISVELEMLSMRWKQASIIPVGCLTFAFETFPSVIFELWTELVGNWDSLFHHGFRLSIFIVCILFAVSFCS